MASSSPHEAYEPGAAMDMDAPLANSDSVHASTSPATDHREDKEPSVGITEFINLNPFGYNCTLKKRYTDFLVNEILFSGEVIHLTDLRPPLKNPLKPNPESKPKGILLEVPRPELGTIKDKRQVNNVDVVLNKDQVNNSLPLKTASGPENSVHIPVDVSNNAKSPEARPPSEHPEENIGPATGEISQADHDLLESYFGKGHVVAITDLYSKILKTPNAKASSFPVVKVPPITDRKLRTQIHQEMRRIFQSKIETSTDSEGQMSIACAGKGQWHRNNDGKSGNSARNQLPAKMQWQERGGEYLHFSLYKENKDTMEVMGFIQRQLSTTPRNLQFAGTKDRRAVTVQRMSAYHFTADRLAGINRTLRNAKIGDYKYLPYGLRLGDLLGNEFVITLRDCTTISGEPIQNVEHLTSLLSDRIASFSKSGFINYYGLQRFGSFTTRTDTVGKLMLKGDYQGACDALTSYAPEVLDAALSPNQQGSNKISEEDKIRARALFAWKVRGRAQQALRDLPRKFSAEGAIMLHLSKPRMGNDYIGALDHIPRALRLMYVHAHQSRIFNEAASERWRLYGANVVEGDLVIMTDAEKNGTTPGDVDEQGEVVIHANSESAEVGDSGFERARPLSAEEAASGKYSIFDIVLPSPGYDVIYPANTIGKFYETFMASEEGGGLDPHDMRRSWKTVSLSGNYRHVFARPLKDGKIDFQVVKYAGELDQLVETDLDRLNKAKQEQAKENAKREAEKAGITTGEGIKADERGEPLIMGGASEEPAPAPENSNVAIILTLQLGSSQYATMALRELLGPKGVTTHKHDYAGPR
ncbi:MAG: hypothetical protein M1814_005259 [Vezdaea aestivalis]|nr:MAG: hypothetical protein M1814_005259 [Vezdaea aestivalis]